MAEKKRKDARTVCVCVCVRERGRRENEKREERYSNFVPSLAPKISMCNNLSSGPAEVSGRTIPTTCMHNLCRWFSRKRTGPKEARVAPYQDRIFHLFDLSLKKKNSKWVMKKLWKILSTLSKLLRVIILHRWMPLIQKKFGKNKKKREKFYFSCANKRNY